MNDGFEQKRFTEGSIARYWKFRDAFFTSAFYTALFCGHGAGGRVTAVNTPAGFLRRRTEHCMDNTEPKESPGRMRRPPIGKRMEKL
jgi:hypothetical protein